MLFKKYKKNGGICIAYNNSDSNDSSDNENELKMNLK